LPADSNPADLARYVVTVSQGMAVQAASGASREELQTGGGDGDARMAAVRVNQ